MTPYEVQTEKRGLVNAGYIKRKPSNPNLKNVVALWQKRFADEKGVKYVIVAYEWNNLRNLKPNETPFIGLEYHVLLKDAQSDCTMALDFISDWRREMVEARVEEMFNSGSWKYYQL